METRAKRIEQRMEGMEAKLEEIKRRIRTLDSEHARLRTWRHHAPSRRSGNRIESNTVSRNQKPFEKEERDETEEKVEKSESKSRKPKGRRARHESEKERTKGFSDEPLGAVVKPTGAAIDGDEEAPWQEWMPEDSPATTTGGGTTLTEAWLANRLVESSFSLHEGMRRTER